MDSTCDWIKDKSSPPAVTFDRFETKSTAQVPIVPATNFNPNCTKTSGAAAVTDERLRLQCTELHGGGVTMATAVPSPVSCCLFPKQCKTELFPVSLTAPSPFMSTRQLHPVVQWKEARAFRTINLCLCAGTVSSSHQGAVVSQMKTSTFWILWMSFEQHDTSPLDVTKFYTLSPLMLFYCTLVIFTSLPL